MYPKIVSYTLSEGPFPPLRSNLSRFHFSLSKIFRQYHAYNKKICVENYNSSIDDFDINIFFLHGFSMLFLISLCFITCFFFFHIEKWQSFFLQSDRESVREPSKWVKIERHARQLVKKRKKIIPAYTHMHLTANKHFPNKIDWKLYTNYKYRRFCACAYTTTKKSFLENREEKKNKK